MERLKMSKAGAGVPDGPSQEEMEKLGKLRPIDEEFMRRLFLGDPAVAQTLFERVPGLEGVRVVCVTAPEELSRLVGGCLVFDIQALDEEGRPVCAYIQRIHTSDDLEPTLVKYAVEKQLASMGPGDRYEDLPQICVLYVFENALSAYEWNDKRLLNSYDSRFPEYDIRMRPQKIRYINATGEPDEGEEPLQEIMRDFLQSDPRFMRVEVIAAESEYHKRPNRQLTGARIRAGDYM